MAEVHFLGRIVGGEDFQDHSIFCKWEIVFGKNWRLLEGNVKSQTQTDCPQEEAYATWSHPLDLHFATKGIQGWPKFNCQVWHLDPYGRTELWAYGFLHLPTSSGPHHLTCHTWRPAGSPAQEFARCFLGGGSQLRTNEMAFAPNERYRLQTVAMGKVHLEVTVILRNFHKFGIET